VPAVGEGDGDGDANVLNTCVGETAIWPRPRTKAPRQEEQSKSSRRAVDEQAKTRDVAFLVISYGWTRRGERGFTAWHLDVLSSFMYTAELSNSLSRVGTYFTDKWKSHLFSPYTSFRPSSENGISPQMRFTATRLGPRARSSVTTTTTSHFRPLLLAAHASHQHDPTNTLRYYGTSQYDTARIQPTHTSQMAGPVRGHMEKTKCHDLDSFAWRLTPQSNLMTLGLGDATAPVWTHNTTSNNLDSEPEWPQWDHMRGRDPMCSAKPHVSQYCTAAPFPGEPRRGRSTGTSTRAYGSILRPPPLGEIHIPVQDPELYPALTSQLVAVRRRFCISTSPR
jgi:hypothetical protein